MPLAVPFKYLTKVFEPFYQSTVSYHKNTKIGALQPKITFAQRFNQRALQLGIDAYPKFSEQSSAFLSYSYANTSILPRHYAAAEFYHNFSNGIEASVGARYLGFDTTKVTFITGSFGVYTGDYFIAFRPFYIPQSNGDSGFAANIMARRYFTKQTYLGVTFSYGITADFNQIIVENTLLAETLNYLESQQLEITYQFKVKGTTNLCRPSLAVQRQELAFNSGNFTIAVIAGLSYQFSL